MKEELKRGGARVLTARTLCQQSTSMLDVVEDNIDRMTGLRFSNIY